MSGVYTQAVEAALRELASQRTARHTIHEVLYGLHRAIRFSSGAVILKDPETERLVIANRYEITEKFARSFSKAIGRERIGALYYERDFVVFDKDSDSEAHEEFRLERDYHTGVCVRLAAQNRTLGYLALFFEGPFTPTDDDRAFLHALAHVCALSLHQEELVRTLNELRRTEPETGLLTYHYFHERLRNAFLRDKRYDEGLTLVLMDLDNYNDVASLYGVDTAKALYKAVADELTSTLRESDAVGYYGKDELIVLLPSTAIEQAEPLARRLQQDIHRRQFGDRKLKTTVSVGVAGRRPDDTLTALLERLSTALHQARRPGKGGLVVA